MYLALNNQQKLICHKTQRTNEPTNEPTWTWSLFLICSVPCITLQVNGTQQQKDESFKKVNRRSRDYLANLSISFSRLRVTRYIWSSIVNWKQLLTIWLDHQIQSAKLQCLVDTTNIRLKWVLLQTSILDNSSLYLTSFCGCSTRWQALRRARNYWNICKTVTTMVNYFITWFGWTAIFSVSF